jgi:hypothetical protein
MKNLPMKVCPGYKKAGRVAYFTLKANKLILSVTSFRIRDNSINAGLIN